MLPKKRDLPMKADSHAQKIEREFVKKMHRDMLALIERRYRISLYKVLFLTGLLGIGSSKLPASIEITQRHMYAILPIIAIFWDFLFFEQDFAIKRISKFIRCKEQQFGLEAVWEKWLRGDYGEHVGKGIFFLLVPTYGITGVTIVLASVALWVTQPQSPNAIDQLLNPIYYFPVLSVFYIVLCVVERARNERVSGEPKCARIKASARSEEKS